MVAGFLLLTSKRCWIAAIALGLVSTAHAQVPQEHRAVAGKEESAISRVIIVETPSQAESAAEREKTSNEHDAADLDAQVRSANAAERSATTAEWQVIPTMIISIVGTVVALIAVVFTVVSNRRSERIARAQTRAYLSFDGAWLIENLSQFGCKFNNYGTTPAEKVVISIKVAVGVADQKRPDALTWSDPIELAPISVAPGQPIQRGFGLSLSQVNSLREFRLNGNWFYAFVTLRYYDEFGVRHRRNIFLSSETQQLEHPSREGVVGVGAISMSDETNDTGA